MIEDNLADIADGFDAASAALGHLMLGQGGKEARCRPALLVGLSGEVGPDLFDGGKS